MSKIIESLNIEDYEVLTDTGFENIKKIHKTEKYQIVEIYTTNYSVNCSFNHIFFDQNYNNVHCFDLSEGDIIQTITGAEEIIKIVPRLDEEHMYDLELGDGNRRYYTEGILSHNTHVGKTSNMIALGANFLKNGEDVLYITLEMSEDKIAQRFDANYLGVDINDVPLMKEKTFKSRLKQIRSKVEGELIIKEYSPATIGANKIRALIEELKIKQDFNPKIIIIDYLNLMVSDRIKTDSLYSNGKAISEEIRGLGVDYECCVLTATQGNREMNAADVSDADFTNVSESKAVMDTADCSVAILMPSELREQNIQIWKILKNRYGGIVDQKIPLKVNFARAMLYEMNQEIQLQGNNINISSINAEKARAKKRNKIRVDVEDTEVENELDSLLDE